ncbi:MAG: sigma factor-like helix-turn-helix DNA-binding protein, partial [Thermoleophilaceae bacterium]
MEPIPPNPLAEALAALDPADRALLELSFRGGMPADEVADALGSSETSVVDRREAALAELREDL